MHPFGGADACKQWICGPGAHVSENRSEFGMSGSAKDKYLGSNMHPADALLELREEMKRLQEVEKQLRKIIIEDEQMRAGSWATAKIDCIMVKRLDRSKVEKLVKNMDDVITEVETIYVRVAKHSGTP